MRYRLGAPDISCDGALLAPPCSSVSEFPLRFQFTLVSAALLLTVPNASTQDRRLEAGRQYIIVGVCDDDCGDLDLILSDPSGQEIAADREDDPLPIIAAVPQRTGDYTFRVQMYECRVEPCAYLVQPFVRGVVQAGPARPGPQGGAPVGARVERGRLEAGDRTLPAGEYYDVYMVQGRAGEQLVIDLESTEFDTYLLIRGPGGLSEDNDDHEGSTQRSRIAVTLPVDGEYLISVTSFRAGETGAYMLTISRGAAAPGAETP